MKKLGTQIIMVVLAMSALMAQEGLKTDCKKQCLVSRVIEEGVMLGVKVNGISKCTPLARINEIVPQSAADKAGLQMGDLILKINDAEVSETLSLYDIIQSHKAGDIVLLTYVAGAETKKMKVRLGARTTKIVEQMECCEDDNSSEIALSDGVTVFPNPATTEIHIKTKEALEGDTHINIYTVDGKEMFFEFKKMNERLNRTINVSEYANGPYFLKIETNKKSYVKKFEIKR